MSTKWSNLVPNATSSGQPFDLSHLDDFYASCSFLHAVLLTINPPPIDPFQSKPTTGPALTRWIMRYVLDEYERHRPNGYRSITDQNPIQRFMKSDSELMAFLSQWDITAKFPFFCAACSNTVVDLIVDPVCKGCWKNTVWGKSVADVGLTRPGFARSGFLTPAVGVPGPFGRSFVTALSDEWMIACAKEQKIE